MAIIDLMDRFGNLGEGGIRNNGTLDSEVLFQPALRTMRTDFIQVKAGDSIVYKNMNGMSSSWNILSFYTGEAQGYYVSGIAGQTTPQSGVWTAAQDGYIRLFGSFPAGDNISVMMTDLAPDVEDYLSQYNAMNYRFLPNSIPKIVAHIQEYLSDHPIADSTTLQAVIDAAFESYMEEIQETADTYISEAVPPAAAAAVDAAASPALAEITAKAAEAAESAREAALSEQSAEMSEENALSYRNQAQQIKDSISAEVAASVLAAQEQATLAQGSAQAADESADTAEQFVAQARAQAEAAADHAQTASGYASDAQGYMQDASGFAQNASDFADAAAQSAATFTTDTTLTISGKAADAKATGDQLSDLKSQVAPEYDATATYIKDSFVRKDGKLYHNTEPITTPEAWTASHWREVYVGAELTDLSQRADVLEWLARSRGLTPAQLQQIAASGHADEYFDIGDVIFIPWTDKTPAEPVTYDYPFVVVAFRDCVDANGVTHENALWIQALYATPQTIAFDAPEQVIADEATFQPDTYYYTKEDADWHQEEVTVGDPIPSGETYWKHYRSGMAGRIRYGSNDYEQSAYRQWLNSDRDKGDWWTAQHPSDVAPAQATTVPGWLTGFTEDWLAIFQPVEIKQAKNTVCDGGETAVMYDKFFLPSISELYGSQSLAAIEGAYWPYWKEATGLPSPTNGSSSNTNDARKIPAVSAPEGSAVAVRLRSANRSYTNYQFIVYSTGYLYSGTAYSAYRALPACVIYESTNVGA